MGGREGDIWSLMGSSSKAIALMTPHAMISIWSAEWNKTTNSVAKYWSIPVGCVYPNSMQSSMMSSSCMKVASNRVPSPLVTTRTHIWLMSSTLSPGMWSGAAKWLQWTWWTLQRKTRDIFSKDGCIVYLEKSAGYHNGVVKPPDL